MDEVYLEDALRFFAFYRTAGLNCQHFPPSGKIKGAANSQQIPFVDLEGAAHNQSGSGGLL